jgi:hypothetical protein
LSPKGRKNAAFNKLKIIESVIKSEPHGMNTSELASEIGIHITTVTRLCKPLVKNRFLMDKKYKHGRYHITEKVYADPKLQASLFAGESTRGIFYGFDNYLPQSSEKFALKHFQDSSLSENKFWTRLEKILSNHPSEEKMTLLNFAMKAGIQMLYVMTEATHKRLLELTLGKNTIGQVSLELKGVEKDRLAEIWVKNAINPVLIFREFRKLRVIRRGLAIPRQIPEYKDKELAKEIQKSRRNPFIPVNPTLFESDKENLNKITKAFEELWPMTYQGFEAIKSKLPRLVDSTLETRDELERLDSEKNITEKLKMKLAKKSRIPVSNSFKMLFDSAAADEPRCKQDSRKRKPSNRG